MGNSHRSFWLFSLGLGLVVLTGLFNIGIIAIDDYACIISKIIPSQSISFQQVISERDIRSPFAPIFLLSMTKAAYRLGIEDPAWQLRLVLVIIGIFSYLSFTGAGVSLFKQNKTKIDWLLFLSGFYFVCPLILTRPLIESLSAPFVILSCLFSQNYWNNSDRKSLSLALLFVILASMFRFQSGVCVLGLLILILIRKNLKDIVLFVLLSIAGFILTGWLDQLLTGRFHGSLITYVNYNLNYSSGFGVTPFYTFLLLLVGLSFPPALISKYSGLDWKREFSGLVAALSYLFVFVFAHSVVPHKEERFIIPILPIYLILLVPFLYHITENNPRSWRLKLFVGFNLFLLPMASFNIPQNNVISLVRYLDKHPKIKTILAIDDTLVLYTKAYSSHPPNYLKITAEEIDQLRKVDCDILVAIRNDYESSLKVFLELNQKIAEFKPGPLEALLVRLNPKQNLRRGAISLYADPKCASQF